MIGARRSCRFSLAVLVALIILPVIATAQDAGPSVAGSVIGTIGEGLEMDVAKRVRAPEAGRPRVTIVGAGDLGGADRADLKKQFAAGVPIALIEPSAADVAALRGAIGLSAASAPLADAADLAAYAIDQASDHSLHELIIPASTPLPPATVVSITGNETTGTVSTTRQEAAPFRETEAVRKERVDEIIAWLQQDQTRDTAVTVRRARALKATATADGSDKFKPLEDVVQSTESRAVFQFRNNTHTLITNVWSVHNATLNEDWFFVQQRGQFSARNELLPLALVNNISNQEGNDRGRFTDFYSVDTRVPQLTDNDAVWTESSSPSTTSGVDKVSSSVSWSLTGKLSGNAKVASDGKSEIGAGAEIGGGVSVNNSISFDVPDVTVRNQSGTLRNNAAWEYAINAPAWTNGAACIGFWGLGPLKQMSAGTFQPVQQWIWRVSPAARTKYPDGLPIMVQFQTRVRHIYYGPGCNWNMTDWNQYSPKYGAGFKVPWPAIK